MLNGRATIPIAKWKKELITLDTGHDALYADYTRLRTEARDAETILRCVEPLLREESLAQTEKEKTTTR